MRFLFVLILLFSHLQSFAKAKASVNISFTMSMPPYYFEGQKKGIEYEIIEAAFKAENIKINRIYNTHLKRSIRLLNDKNIDVIIGNKTNLLYEKEIPDLITSQSVVDYIDCAITSKTSELKLSEPETYKTKTVYAFKTASLTLPKKYTDAFKKNANYSEKPQQDYQCLLLKKDRIDIAISDKNIFLYRAINACKSKPTDFKYHQLSPSTPRNLKLIDKKLRDKFNSGLKKIKNDGTYQKILNKYKDLYHTKC